jgi:hypothetical protein
MRWRTRSGDGSACPLGRNALGLNLQADAAPSHGAGAGFTDRFRGAAARFHRMGKAR